MDGLQFFLLEYRELQPWATRVLLDEPTAEQIRRRPADGVNTIAWLVWHMARLEDIGANRLVGHRPQLFFEEGWDKRLNVPRTDFGMDMNADEVVDVSARIDLGALREYWNAVYRRTLLVVAGLKPEDLDELNEPDYIRLVLREEGVLTGAASRRVEYFATMPERSRGWVLSHTALTHKHHHLGEGLVIRSLLGVSGN